MSHPISVYWAPGHNRPSDIDYMRALQPAYILILDPDVEQISVAHQTVPDAQIVLRSWSLDDNNGQAVRDLKRDARQTGAQHAMDWHKRITELEHMARSRSIPFPDRSQLLCHALNEPPTGEPDMPEAINRYTVTLCDTCRRESIRAAALIFGTGHPAHLHEGAPDWRPFEAALDAIERGNHLVTLHEYYNDLGIEDESVNPWHIMRHQWFPRPEMPIFVGEWGLDMILNGRSDGHYGWQNVCDADEYAADLEWYCHFMAPNVVGVAPFLTDFRGRPWHRGFDTEPAHPEFLNVAKRWADDSTPDECETIRSDIWTLGGLLRIRGNAANQQLGVNVQQLIDEFDA